MMMTFSLDIQQSNIKYKKEIKVQSLIILNYTEGGVLTVS